MTTFDEDGTPTEAIPFDFDAIDEALGNTLDVIAQSHSRIPRFEALVLRKLLDWIVQAVPKNNDGIEVRAVIVAWTFLPHLRAHSLTEIASKVNRDKQSLGRWVDDFKIQFPGVMKK